MSKKGDRHAVKENHHAIVIGLNDYPVSGLASLKGPVNDAEDFYAWLCDPKGGNLAEKNIHRILSTDFIAETDEEVSRETVQPVPNQIEALFEPFVTKGLQGPCGERLYIFVAGHGFGDPGDMGSTALYAANARKTFPWHVAITDYVDWLRRHAVFDEIVLIMDCCRTVNSHHTIREPQYPTSKGRTAADQVRYFSAFAVGRGRVARERRFEDGRDSGIFTRAVLNALRTARPRRGKITGQMLKDQIHNSIDKFAGEAQIEPPEIRLDSYRDIDFLRRRTAESVPVHVVLEAYSGEEILVLFDGSFKEIKREKAVSETMTLDLEPGLYKIAVKDTGRQEIFEVPNNARITV